MHPSVPSLRLVCLALALSAAATAPAAEPADVAPVLVKRVDPEYPRELRNQGVHGEVLVELAVDAQGRVTSARAVRSSHPGLEAPALTAAQRWKFTPGRHGGQPVAMTVQMPLRFGVDLFDDRLLTTYNADAPPPVEAPKPRQPYRAVYPFDHALAGTAGVAQLSFIVDDAGYVRDPEIVQATNPEFGAAALAALEPMRFDPAQQAGASVPARARHEFRFGGAGAEASVDAPTAALIAQLNSGRKPPTPRELDGVPKRLAGPAPRLPIGLWQEGRGGSATIEFYIAPDGRVLLPRIVKADDERLGWAAMTAIAQWTFEPPLKNGQPVLARLAVPVNFPAPVKETAEAK